MSDSNITLSINIYQNNHFYFESDCLGFILSGGGVLTPLRPLENGNYSGINSMER